MSSEIFNPTMSHAEDLAPFRAVAYEQLRKTQNYAAPTIDDPSEIHETLTPLPSLRNLKSPESAKSAPSVAEKSRPAPIEQTVRVPEGTLFKLVIHAQTVHIYNMALSLPPDSAQGASEDTGFHTFPQQASKPQNATTGQSGTDNDAFWRAQQLSTILNPRPVYTEGFDERNFLPPSPRVYPHGYTSDSGYDIRVVKPSPPMNGISLPSPQEPDKAPLSSHSGPYRLPATSSANGISTTPSSPLTATWTSSITPKTSATTVCKKGSQDCTCIDVASFDLLKDAATYLYTMSRSLAKELLDISQQVNRLLNELQDDDLLKAGAPLPSKVYAFLETETAQLLQDWANAEAKCSQYICDCILADVNAGDKAHQAFTPAGASKGKDSEAPVPTSSGEPMVESAMGTSQTASDHQKDCTGRFEEVKELLIELRDRSDRVLKQWHNLYELCSTLATAAKIA